MHRIYQCIMNQCIMRSRSGWYNEEVILLLKGILYIHIHSSSVYICVQVPQGSDGDINKMLFTPNPFYKHAYIVYMCAIRKLYTGVGR